MDYQILFNAASSLVIILIGFILSNFRTTINDLNTKDTELAKEVHAIHILVAGNYVRKEEHNAAFHKLYETLIRIENKLDTKMDKTP